MNKKIKALLASDNIDNQWLAISLMIGKKVPLYDIVDILLEDFDTLCDDIKVMGGTRKFHNLIMSNHYPFKVRFISHMLGLIADTYFVYPKLNLNIAIERYTQLPITKKLPYRFSANITNEGETKKLPYRFSANITNEGETEIIAGTGTRNNLESIQMKIHAELETWIYERLNPKD